MNIDLFTLIIQIFNFSLLVFVLNKLLYKPLLKMIRDRKDYIRDKIEGAEKKYDEANSIKENYQKELDEINEYKKNQILKIDEENISYKEKSLKCIENKIIEEKENLLNQFDKDKNIIANNIVKSVCFNIDEFLQNIFKLMIDTDVNVLFLKNFLDQLNNLEPDKIEKLKNKEINFISSFNLNNNLKDNVINKFKMLNINDNINFIIDENLIIGSKITAGEIIINSNIQDMILQFTDKIKKII